MPERAPVAGAIDPPRALEEGVAGGRGVDLETVGTPFVTVVVPVYNNAATLDLTIQSVMLQRSVRTRVVVIDHGSNDGSDRIARTWAVHHPGRVTCIRLVRQPTDRHNPARPLNVGLALAAATAPPGQHSWVIRLDGDDVLTDDDVLATQLRLGDYRQMIAATLVFFSVEEQYAYDYGPVARQRSLVALRKGGAYTLGHHATAIRTDLLTTP